VIPAFNQHDNLPAGEHHTTWQEFVQHFSWNTYRATLIGGLRAALIALQTCGCETAWIDGSFATRKTNPNDIDVAWDDETTDFDLLEQLEPTLLDFANRRAAQKRKFGCEFFPATWDADSNGTTFLEYFQKDRNNDPKGIIRISLNTL
jgi:hypothetical protein